MEGVSHGNENSGSLHRGQGEGKMAREFFLAWNAQGNPFVKEEGKNS